MTVLYIATNAPGTVDVTTAGEVTGYGTAFTVSDLGRTITFRTPAGDVRTTITAFTSPTSIEVAAAFPLDYTGLYYYLDYQQVDLYEDVVVPLTFAVADIRNPDKRDTSFSKTITIPGSQENNKLFGHIFEIDIDGQFNPNIKALAFLDIDTIEQFRGVAQLLRINIKEGGKKEYEIALYGTTGGFFFNLNSKELRDLDLSQYNHLPTVDNIVNSWDTSVVKNGSAYNNFTGDPNTFFPNGEPNGEGYVYGLADLGIADLTSLTPRFLYLKLPCCIYAKTVVDAMFKATGYTYTSNFLSGTDPSKLFPKLVTMGRPRSRRARFTFKLRRDFASPDPGYVSFRFALHRVSSFDATDTIVNQVPGFGHSFELFPTDPDVVEFEVSVNDGDVFYLTGFVFAPSVFAPQGNIKIDSFFKVEYLDESNGGLTYSFQAVHPGPAYLIGATPALLHFTNDSVAPAFDPQNTWDTATSRHTAPSSLSLTLPANVKCVDFFMSLVKMFNLYIDRDEDNTNNLIIEPRDAYYDQGVVVDWTRKLDVSKDIQLVPMGELDFRTMNYTYADDTDFWNAKYKKDYNETFGQRTFSIDNDFIKNEKTTQLIFAATPSVQAIGNEFVIVPQVVKDDPAVGSPNVFENPKPRILIYGGMRSTGSNEIFIDFDLYTAYPYIGMWDDPINPTLSILFETPREVYYVIEYAYQLANMKDLFQVYHNSYVSEIADKDSKIYIAYFLLNPADIFQLDFRNRFFIDGTYLRLNKVLEYDPVTYKVTKCELIKVKKQAPYSTRAVIIKPKVPVIGHYLIEGALDEVRSIRASSIYDKVDGGIDEVRSISASSNYYIIKG